MALLMPNASKGLTKLPAGEYRVIVSREGHRTEPEHVKAGQGLHTAESSGRAEN